MIGASLWLTARSDPQPVSRFEITPAGIAAVAVDAQSRDLTISQDGTRIVYKGTGTTGAQLFVRSRDQLEPVPLQGLNLPRAPFLSADGQWIGYIDPAPITMRKVAVTGGPAIAICRLDGSSRGATWGDNDTIVFATSNTATGLQRVSPQGGEPLVLTRPDPQRGEGDHLWPQFLPGSQAVLFTITATAGGLDASQVAVFDTRSGMTKTLLKGGSQAQYTSSGHLVYVAAGTLRAVAFDLERLETIGASLPVLPQVMMLPTGTAEFDIADDGTLIYLAGGNASQVRTLVWVDRQGREEPVKAAPARAYVVPRVSPDGTRIAVEVRDYEFDIWVWDLARETFTRVTSDPGTEMTPTWMPDGQRLVFTAQIGGAAGSIFRQAADGTGSPERLTDSPNVQRPSAVSADGTRILFWEGGPTTANDIMMLTSGKEPLVQPLIQTKFAERNAEFSPDGRWLAYESNDSGEGQVFVRPFPDVGHSKWQISTAGGLQPVWGRTGRELFYLSREGALMRVPVEAGTTWRAGAPTKLFDWPQFRGPGSNISRSYDISRDHERFLMLKQGDDATPGAAPSIVVVQNWHEELKRLVPVAR
jgi:serine/threonine-protein kinase